MAKKPNIETDFRKRKETEKEKRRKERNKKLKEGFESIRLTVTIFLLIGANLVFLISATVQYLASKEISDAVQIEETEQPANIPRQKPLKVEVLNGCGVYGVASQLTDYLRKNGVDVVYFGNYETWTLSQTLVIDRRDGELSNAKRIGKIIGVNENRMFPQMSPQRQVDVTIIIGKNYSESKAFN